MTYFQIIYILIITSLVLTFTFFPFLDYYIYGWMPFIRARLLSDIMKQDIHKYGIAHCTKRKYATKIIDSKYIKSSSKLNSYSNHLKHSTFFFFRNSISEGLKSNLSKKKSEVVIIITNLTLEQIDKIQYRECDNSLIYTGDFMFNPRVPKYYTYVSLKTA